MEDTYVKAATYFFEHAGNDGKLSWEEMQNAPIKTVDCNDNPIETLEVTKQDFKKASKYDNDPDKLSYDEFISLLKGKGINPIDKGVETKVAVRGSDYFLKNSGKDGKLSWSEIEKAGPIELIKVKVFLMDKIISDDGQPTGTVNITKEDFKHAQDVEYDNDPDGLNYYEFAKMMEGKGVDYMSPHPYCVAFVRDSQNEGYLMGKMSEIIHKGIVSGINDAWVARRKEIEKAIKEDNLSEAVAKLCHFFDIINMTSSFYNPYYDDICDSSTGASTSFVDQELTSEMSLKNGTVRSFWQDVGALLDSLAGKAKKQGVKNLGELFEEAGGFMCESGLEKFIAVFEVVNPKLAKSIKKWSQK